MNVCNKEKHTRVQEFSEGDWMCLLPLLGLCAWQPDPRWCRRWHTVQGDAFQKVQGTLGSVIFLLVILHRFEEEALLQAVLEVVDHCPLEVLDAAWTSQNVALIWIQLQGVVGLHLHQSAQELCTVLEVDLCFWTHTYAHNTEFKCCK